MKLLRYGETGAERPAIMDANGDIRDLSNSVGDIASSHLQRESLLQLASLNTKQLPLVDPSSRLGPCVGNVGKWIGVGLNYFDHATEMGIEVPDEPLIFNKATNSICGPNDDIIIPIGSTKTDWEVELGVIIGSPAKRVMVDDALAYVAGYCVVNDVSEREYQYERGGQWTKGKSFDSFGPLGPWLVTADEVADPQALDLWLKVDGKLYQHSNTAQMVQSVAQLVSYISQFLTLYPGDVIATGTPAGVGFGVKPNPVYLRPGQVVTLGITGLGVQCQKTVAER